ncbi:MAG: hypothetical protein ACI934_001130, partial [Pseudohongiellaceae bacterium]
SIIYFALAVRTLLGSGFSGGGMLTVLVLTAAFVGVCLFIPLELKESQVET